MAQKLRKDLRGNPQLLEKATMRKMLRACIGGILCTAVASGGGGRARGSQGQCAVEGGGPVGLELPALDLGGSAESPRWKDAPVRRSVSVIQHSGLRECRVPHGGPVYGPDCGSRIA